MIKIIVLFICCFWAYTSLGQNALYQGGNGDGFASAKSSITTLTNDDLSVMFRGGEGDGFTHASTPVTTLNNDNLSVMFNGGAGDGFALAAIPVSTLSNEDLSVLFHGGDGDGFALNVSNSYVLNDFPRIKLEIKVVLQGAALNQNTGEENLMRDDLRVKNLLPTISPYGDGITCDNNVFNNGGSTGSGSVSDNIVDWVFIEIRNNTDNTIIETSKSALLQRDGDVVDIDGISPLTISYTPGYYHVAIKHRNHLGVMSATSAYLSHEIQDANFINGSFNVYGSNSRINLNGIMALWAGDANNDGSIDLSGTTNDFDAIKNIVLYDSSNTFGLLTFISTNRYSLSDLDMDGEVRFSGRKNDTNISKDNIIIHPSNTSESINFIIIQQIPNN